MLNLAEVGVQGSCKLIWYLLHPGAKCFEGSFHKLFGLFVDISTGAVPVLAKVSLGHQLR